MQIDLKKIFQPTRLPDGVKELTPTQNDLLVKYQDAARFMLAWNPEHGKYCNDKLKESWQLFQMSDVARTFGITCVENWLLSQIVNLLLAGGIRSMDNKDAMACAKTLASAQYIQTARAPQIMAFFYRVKVGEITFDWLNAQNLIVELRKFIIETNEIIGEARQKHLAENQPKMIADPPITYDEYCRIKEEEEKLKQQQNGINNTNS